MCIDCVMILLNLFKNIY